MADIPRLDSAEVGWALAGVGFVAGEWLLNKVPTWLGQYTSLVVGVVLIFVAMKYIHEHEYAALAFGAGFAMALEGVIAIFMPSRSPLLSVNF
jgi:predicted MFS family arabinose efflux permease